MKNLIYAIEQLGTTPACDYSALSGQALNTPVVVTMFGADDTDLAKLGVGYNTNSGQTAIYLGVEGSDEDDPAEYGQVKYRSNSTNLSNDLQTLFTKINTLAQTWLSS